MIKLKTISTEEFQAKVAALRKDGYTRVQAEDEVRLGLRRNFITLALELKTDVAEEDIKNALDSYGLEAEVTDVTPHEYTEMQMNTIGDRIAKILHMKRDREYCDRWQTSIGTKTGKGLFLTLSRFIHEVEQNHPDSELLK